MIGFVATLIGGMFLAIGCPLFGHWSDKIARPLHHGDHVLAVRADLLPVLLVDGCLAVADGLSLSPSFGFNLIKAGYSGVLPSLLAEQFPVEVRAIGVSLSFSTAVSIFGGLAPLVATWLIAQTGDSLSPSYYLIFTALLSLIALIAIQRRGRLVTRAISAARAA